MRNITSGRFAWARAPSEVVHGALVRYRIDGEATFHERGSDWSRATLVARWMGYGWLLGRWERADRDARWSWVEAALGGDNGSAGAVGEKGTGLGDGRREDDFTCWHCKNVGHGYRDTCGMCFHDRPVVIAAFEAA